MNISKERIIELLKQAENSKCRCDCEFCKVKKCESKEFDDAIDTAIRLVEMYYKDDNQLKRFKVSITTPDGDAVYSKIIKKKDHAEADEWGLCWCMYVEGKEGWFAHYTVEELSID